MLNTPLKTYLFLIAIVLPFSAIAGLCNKVHDGNVGTDTKRDVDFYEQLFPDRAYHGDKKYNEIILECNRKRDTKGNEVGKQLSAQGSNNTKNTLLKSDLDAKVIRGKYNFFGKVVSQQKYRYILSKRNGEWTMIIPYKAVHNELIPGRTDFFMGTIDVLDGEKGILKDVNKFGPAWQFYEPSQVIVSGSGVNLRYRLKPNARPVAETLCASSTFFSGKENKYNGKSNFNASKRDKENKFIDLGKIQYRYKSSDKPKEAKYSPVYQGCRVNKNIALYWQPESNRLTVEKVLPQDWILDNFIRVAEAYWSSPGNFTLRLFLKGHNDSSFSSSIRNKLKNDDFLTVRFATKFMPYGGNQMYKSNPIQFNNFSTMTTDGTLLHEVGHAFGLDDEYGKKTNKKNHCLNDMYKNLEPGHPDPIYYQMCHSGENAAVTTIYHYLAVSRYDTTQKECSKDTDCQNGEWCDAGIDLKKNQCVAKRNDGANCPAIGGGHACKSGNCKYGQCYSSNSVAMGSSCFVDDQCSAGKCSGIAGARGQCVCHSDSDCGANSICKKGPLGIGRNQCVATRSPTCPSGWSYETRDPLNKDRCNKTTTKTAALECKLLITDKAKNWSGPHAQPGKDECRSVKGKNPKSVKCPSGYKLRINSGADTCTKSTTERKTPTCPSGWDYKSQSGKDICQNI